MLVMTPLALVTVHRLGGHGIETVLGHKKAEVGR